MIELMPCPFCDEPPRLVAADLTGATWVVTCPDCDIEGPFHDSQASAADAWNTRPSEARLRGLLDELQEAAAGVLAIFAPEYLGQVAPYEALADVVTRARRADTTTDGERANG